MEHYNTWLKMYKFICKHILHKRRWKNVFDHGIQNKVAEGTQLFYACMPRAGIDPH